MKSHSNVSFEFISNDRDWDNIISPVASPGQAYSLFQAEMKKQFKFPFPLNSLTVLNLNQTTELPNCFTHNELRITEPCEIASEFNRCFANIRPSHARAIPNSITTKIEDDLEAPNPHSLHSS